MIVPGLRCPCGQGSYDVCCGPLHQQVRDAHRPVELMRSRYSAYALGLSDYVFRTWHPRTRPEDIGDTGTWVGLEIVEATGDEVEFKAHYPGGVLHERSRFERRRGRWVYVDGTTY